MLVFILGPAAKNDKFAFPLLNHRSFLLNPAAKEPGARLKVAVNGWDKLIQPFQKVSELSVSSYFIMQENLLGKTIVSNDVII